MIPQTFIQDLLNRIDIVDVVGRYVQLKKGGANLMGLCPFHNEKSPSFTVSPAKQFYHCFGCGANGSAIRFLMEYSGLGFVEAVEDLAQGLGLTVPDDRVDGAPRRDGPNFAVLSALLERSNQFYREQLKTFDPARQYLKGRGLTVDIANIYGLGYAPDEWNALQAVFGDQYDSKQIADTGLTIDGDKGRRYDRFRGRVTFPIRNTRGAIIGFGGRVIGEGEPKYLNSPETPLFEKGLELYGLHEARKTIRDVGRVLVVEGYMDVVALAQLGVGYAVATLGTACTAAHIQKLTKQADLIIFCFDGDAAGRRAAWRALENSLSLTSDDIVFRFLFLPKEHDPDSFIREFGREAFQAEEGRAWPLSTFLLNELKTELDLSTPEGQAGLVNAAKPHLQRITARGLRLALVKEIAKLTGWDPQEVERITEIKQQASKAQIRVVREPVTDIEKQLFRLLVSQPRLACGSDVEDARHALPENSLLRRVIDVVEANDGIDTATQLLEFFLAGDDISEEDIYVISEIKDAISHSMRFEKAPEMVRLEFTKALSGPKIAWIDSRLQELVKLIASPTTDADLKVGFREEYRQLQADSQAMKLRLKGDID